MDTNTNVDFSRNEIKLGDVFGNIIKAWKHVLIVGIVMALLLGGFRFVPQLKAYVSRDNSKEYSDEQNDRIAELQKDVEEIQNQIEKQNNYVDDSIYINANPNRLEKGMLSYYISTPSTGTDNDYANNVIHAYRKMFDGGKAAKYVKENLPYDIEEEYIQELIYVNTNANVNVDNYLDVAIVHSDEGKLREIMDLAKKYIEENKETVTSTVGEHELLLIADDITFGTDSGITTKRNDLDTYMTALNNELANKQVALSAAQSGSASLGGIVKNSLKYAIVGFVFGVFAAVIYKVLTITLFNKVVSAKQLREAIGLTVLGDIVEQKRLDKLQKLGYRLAGEDPTVLYDEALKVAAYNLNALTDKKDIVVLDLANNGISNEIIDGLPKFDFITDKKFVTGQGTLESFDMLKCLNESSGVVMVVKKQGTKISKLERELDIARTHGSEIVGVITI